MSVDEKVKRLLSAIELEKKKPKPQRRLMRKWFNEIFQLKEDWRVTDTGQNRRFQVHTSTREWAD